MRRAELTPLEFTTLSDAGQDEYIRLLWYTNELRKLWFWQKDEETKILLVKSLEITDRLPDSDKKIMEKFLIYCQKWL